jgi:hypothetical protein
MKTTYFVNYSPASYPVDRLIHCRAFRLLKEAREFARVNAGRYEIVRQTSYSSWNADKSENKTIEEGKNA